MTDKEKIKTFVQEVLGCGCSEDVFKIIEENGREYKGIEYSRINIGNRLLVYLFRTDNRQFILDEMRQNLQLGVADRDENGFNRFRLVYAMRQPADAGVSVKKIFDSMNVDDRTHIHVVNSQIINF